MGWCETQIWYPDGHTVRREVGMADQQDRRQSHRARIVGRLNVLARAILDVRLLDVSLTGARIEHSDLLRPGSSCTLELPAAAGPLVLSGKVVRSTVIGTEEGPAKEKVLRYESGLAFRRLTVQQQAALAKVVEKITPESGLGNGRLTP
jgi:hypothetical protein